MLLYRTHRNGAQFQTGMSPHMWRALPWAMSLVLLCAKLTHSWVASLGIWGFSVVAAVTLISWCPIHYHHWRGKSSGKQLTWKEKSPKETETSIKGVTAQWPQSPVSPCEHGCTMHPKFLGLIFVKISHLPLEALWSILSRVLWLQHGQDMHIFYSNTTNCAWFFKL